MRYLSMAIGAFWWAIAGSGHTQQVYFGNLHGHTSYSDGTGTPADAFAAAKAAGLDFFAITEHNHDKGDGSGVRKDGKLIAKQPALYSGPSSSLVSAAAAATKPTFLALYGQEISTISQGNHINAFDVPSVVSVTNGDVPALLNWIRDHPTTSGEPAFLQFNHPRSGSGEPKDYGRDDYPSEPAWVEAVGPFVSLIEVLNAPALRDGTGFRTHAHQTEYLHYLNMGFHVGPSVGHDNHYRNWGTSTDARVGVIADSLSKADVLKALRARRTFASEDRDLKVVFRANGAISGDITAPPPPQSELNLSVELNDPSEPTARYRIDVFMDEPGGVASKAPVETFRSTGDGTAVLDGVRFTRPGAYVFLRITQSGALEDDEHERDDDQVWTAPVWFEVAPEPGLTTPAIPTLRIASLIPAPVGDDAINEQVVLTNTGAVALDLTGWTVRDLAQNTWTLGSAIVEPGASVTVKRQGQPMSMNNSGDSIELISPAGTVVQRVTYPAVTEGQVVSG